MAIQTPIGLALVFMLAFGTIVQAEFSSPSNTSLNYSGFEAVSFEADDATIRLSVAGTYRGGMFSEKTPGQPPAYDPPTRRLFVASPDRNTIEALDITNPYAPEKIFTIDLIPFGGEANGLGIKRGVLAATVEDIFDPLQPTKVVFWNVDGTLLAQVDVPGRVSRLAFTPNGRQVVITVTIASIDDGGQLLEESAIGIIDMGRVPWGACRQGRWSCQLKPHLQIVDFKGFNNQKEDLIAAGLRLLPDLTVAQSIETSGLTTAADSRYAYVNLPTNNGIATIDLHRRAVTKLVPLGYQDHMVPNNGLDASDRDGAINIRNWPVRSYYMPKDLVAVGAGAHTFLITANEGNLLNEEQARIKDLLLDPIRFPNADELQLDENLGRLKVTAFDGDEDGDGDYDALYAGGTRSFSVFTPDAKLIFDSGDDFEQVTAQAVPQCFNCPSTENDFDNRSDDKGPEPEHVTVGSVGSRRYAFVSFERVGGLVIYDVTNLYKPLFQQYINNRNFAVEPEEVCGEQGQPALPGCELAGDIEPEGLLFIPRSKSPIDVALLVVIHEVSDSTTIYRIDRVRSPGMAKKNGSHP